MVFEHLKRETFFIPKLAMTICGIWPSDERKLRALIVFVMWSAVKVLYVIAHLINASGNIDLDVSIIGILVWTLCSFLTELSVRMNNGRILRLIELKINNWWSLKNLKEREIMKSHRIFGKSFFVISIPFVFIGYDVQGIMDLSFVKNVELSNDHQRAPKDYNTWDIMTSVLTIIMNMRNAIEEYGIFVLFWSLNMHLSKEFKILKTRFQKCLHIECKKKSHQLFRRLVDRHNQLLELSDELKNSFFVILAIEVFGMQIWICLQAYQLAIGMHNGNFMELVATSSNIAMALWLLFILYNSGEFLTTCSEEIADLFYECKWYNLSKESRNNFTIVILRCRMSTTLTVGGFFKLNHPNYKHLVKTVYSYISLILAITKPD